MKIISNNKSLKDFHSLFERNEFKEDDETYQNGFNRRDNA